MKGRKTYEDYTRIEKIILNIVYYVGVVYLVFDDFKKRYIR